MRSCHLKKLIEPADNDLVALLRKLPYTDSEISHAFDMLIDDYGRTLGCTIGLQELPDTRALRLEELGLISRRPDRTVVWTRKGEDMQTLLEAYSTPKRVWRSLIRTPSGATAS
jgi:hypothetical protein